jgi:endonuclease YncB( thermonuclease family)
MYLFQNKLPEKKFWQFIFWSLCIISLMTVIYIQLNTGQTSSFTARCIKIIDGSRMVVWHDDQWFSNRLKVQLYGITCPEKKTNAGKQSRAYVISQISGKIVDIQIIQKRLFGWSTAIVYYNNSCLNEMLVKNALGHVDINLCQMPICKQWAGP